MSDPDATLTEPEPVVPPVAPNPVEPELPLTPVFPVPVAALPVVLACLMVFRSRRFRHLQGQ